MFLFLSKLLPLFVYPIGLACLFLIGALFTLWKRPRLSAIFILLALLAILIPGNGQVAGRMLQSLESRYVPTTDLPTADAIVVLGGATRPQREPRPWIDLMEESDRIVHGARLYQQGKAPFLILSGGRIDWDGNNSASESADMAAIAQAFGVPSSAILQDPTSLNTHENAVNVKQILQQRNFNRILLVTSAMHMPRSIAIFKKQGIDAIPAPTDFLVGENELQDSLKTPEGKLLNLLPDAGNLYHFTRALKEYIGIGVYRLRGWL
jgi:uncharacterized SAM-binding protein YcdF (DUF218 family)